MEKEFDAIIFNPILHPDVIMYPKRGETLNYARLLPTYSREIRIGAGGYTALALSNLGLKCCCLDAIGDDLFGQFTIDEMERSGLEMSYISRFNGDHMVCMILVQDGEGGTMVCNYPREFKSTTYTDYMDMVDRSPDASFFYIYSWFWSFVKPDLLIQPSSNIIRRIKEKGFPTILDINFKTTEAPPRNELNELRKSLPDLDYILPNRYDAEILVGKSDPETTIRRLVDCGANNILLKSGAEGTYVWDGSGITRVPGFKVEVQDTTGAGDMFGGGFLFGLKNGLPATEATVYANAMAAYGISHVKKDKYPDAGTLKQFIQSQDLG